METEMMVVVARRRGERDDDDVNDATIYEIRGWEGGGEKRRRR